TCKFFFIILLFVNEIVLFNTRNTIRGDMKRQYLKLIYIKRFVCRIITTSKIFLYIVCNVRIMIRCSIDLSIFGFYIEFNIIYTETTTWALGQSSPPHTIQILGS